MAFSRRSGFGTCANKLKRPLDFDTSLFHTSSRQVTTGSFFRRLTFKPRARRDEKITRRAATRPGSPAPTIGLRTATQDYLSCAQPAMEVDRVTQILFCLPLPWRL